MHRYLIFFLLLFVRIYGQDIQTIVDRVDKLFRSDFSHGEVLMMIHTPHWERTLGIEVWSRGMDETFIFIKAPKKDRGITTLRKKSEMWNYFPKVDKVIKVPPSMMMGSWMGSDFTNDDLVREVSLLQDYHASFAQEEAPENYVWISLKPKEQTVTIWGEIRLLVGLSDYIPLKQIYFDEHGEKVRILTLRDVREMGGKKIPTILEMVPLNKKDHKTTIKYLWMEFDRDISSEVFSLRNLRRKR